MVLIAPAIYIFLLSSCFLTFSLTRTSLFSSYLAHFFDSLSKTFPENLSCPSGFMDILKHVLFSFRSLLKVNLLKNRKILLPQALSDLDFLSKFFFVPTAA